MPVTAKLSRKFYETFGDEIANELVEWFNAVDATYRADLNELNFSRFDAKLEQRLADSDARWERRISALDSKWERQMAELDAKWDGRMTDSSQMGRTDDGTRCQVGAAPRRVSNRNTSAQGRADQMDLRLHRRRYTHRDRGSDGAR